MKQRPILPGVILFFGLTVSPAFSTAIAESDSKTFQIFVWPGLAPGESSLDTGTTQPFRPSEKPPVTRVEKIRRPGLDIFLPGKPNGTALLILPGGGFGKVVPDKEGSETAPWLNELGIAAFVLSYRTNEVTAKNEPAFRRPLQDAQRALRLMRANAEKWNLKRTGSEFSVSPPAARSPLFFIRLRAKRPTRRWTRSTNTRASRISRC